MDSRLERAKIGWKAIEFYEGKWVTIPDVWELYHFDYPEGKEAQVYLAFGWRDFDMEAVMALGVFDVNYNPDFSLVPHVTVEVARLGSAEIHIMNPSHDINFRFPPNSRIGYLTGDIAI